MCSLTSFIGTLYGTKLHISLYSRYLAPVSMAVLTHTHPHTLYQIVVNLHGLVNTVERPSWCCSSHLWLLNHWLTLISVSEVRAAWRRPIKKIKTTDSSTAHFLGAQSTQCRGWQWVCDIKLTAVSCSASPRSLHMNAHTQHFSIADVNKILI